MKHTFEKRETGKINKYIEVVPFNYKFRKTKSNIYIDIKTIHVFAALVFL